MRSLGRMFALLCLCAPMLAGAAELKPFKAGYSITWNGMSAGNSDLELQHLPDGRWSYSSRSTPRGLFRLAMPADLSSRSVFHIHDSHIVPESFTSDDGAKSDEKDQNLVFDWQRGRVTGVAERKRIDLPTQPGLLDPMSVQMALMVELLAGRVPSRFVLIDKDRIKEYIFNTEGSEKLNTAVGEYHTVIYRSARPGSKKSTLYWCAPDLGYLPLKVERREGKDVELSMSLRKLERNGTG